MAQVVWLKLMYQVSLCFYKPSVLRGWDMSFDWETWNTPMDKSEVTEATTGILNRKWFNSKNSRLSKPLEGWGEWRPAKPRLGKKNKCRDCSEAKWVILRRCMRGLFIILSIFGDKLFRGDSGWKAELTERICSDSSVGMWSSSGGKGN